ncbi:MAG: cbb3-type cytochrome c oxidase subunit II [Bdellovibrionaceae bacterium]|nr:cbb3-type cytochrome c oxidase subunit II [Bdellovibrionales bacterium]MCB9253642.1 cbb3-type cytochrome c oxidase subunit II [Pseudobdellovibrionaceae bacterium]
MDSKIIEKFSGVFLIAGLLLFLVAFITLAIVPVMMVDKIQPTAGIPPEVPEVMMAEFDSHEAYEAALFRGRDIYIAEGCWHCHSQFVRPTANENLRYGPVSTPAEYQNNLHLPQLFGTRRVGPDLSREAGKKSNDWHYAHLYKPTSVVPQSVMPEYPWFFTIGNGAPLLDEDGEVVEDDEGNTVFEQVPLPTDDAKALVAYLQWLGYEAQNRQETQHDYEGVVMPPGE